MARATVIGGPETLKRVLRRKGWGEGTQVGLLELGKSSARLSWKQFGYGINFPERRKEKNKINYTGRKQLTIIDLDPKRKRTENSLMIQDHQAKTAILLND